MALSDLRLSKNMKYTALYWAMRFFEIEPDVFLKTYCDGTQIKILANENKVLINDKESFLLNTHESFVMLEYIDSHIKNNFCKLTDLNIKIDNFKVFDRNIKFFVWDDEFSEKDISENDIGYKSRLISGVIESETKFFHNGSWYDYWDGINYWNNKTLKLENKDFLVKGKRLLRYVGRDKIVCIPDGINTIESCAFWDNQFIEEVKIPDEVVNIGGDTFYNCKNLKKVNIPKECTLMGNNPFAGCPDIEIRNDSNHFVYENGALYTADKKTLIYCSIKGKEKQFIVPEGVEVICKHTFFLCDRLECVVLPSSLKKMENNPFSGCSKLSIVNNSSAYHIIDDVIYNQFKTAVVGALNKISTNCLIIPEGIKTINRNSFWNCKGIKKIVFPKSLIDIGYNPFVGCSNIHFESYSHLYRVVDDVLYTEDLTKLICYPAWKAVGDISLPDHVISLERGAFSGCDKMASISLHNVSTINKSCFTNCTALNSIYCSDLISYIGEWAFAYTTSLKSISIGPNTIIDNNAFSNSNAKLIKRDALSNYVIESDNIYTLNSMLKNYKGRIDSILIDPPYNSNIDYIGYKDSDYDEGYIYFLKSRFEIGRQLLSDEGFMIINIDEGEVANVEKLAKDIFGKDLVSVHKWKKKHPFFDVNRVVLNPNKKQTDFEYIIVCRKTEKSVLNHIKQPYIKDNKIYEKDSQFPDIFDCFGTTSSAKDEIKELFGSREYFSTPKPVKLIKEFVRATTRKDSIILDYFAGSGTTGQAVEELNNSDGGLRKYILVSNNESNICKKVTYERMKKINSEFIFLGDDTNEKQLSEKNHLYPKFQIKYWKQRHGKKYTKKDNQVSDFNPRNIFYKKRYYSNGEANDTLENLISPFEAYVSKLIRRIDNASNNVNLSQNDIDILKLYIYFCGCRHEFTTEVIKDDAWGIYESNKYFLGMPRIMCQEDAIKMSKMIVREFYKLKDKKKNNTKIDLNENFEWYPTVGLHLAIIRSIGPQLIISDRFCVIENTMDSDFLYSYVPVTPNTALLLVNASYFLDNKTFEFAKKSLSLMHGGDGNDPWLSVIFGSYGNFEQLLFCSYAPSNIDKTKDKQIVAKNPNIKSVAINTCPSEIVNCLNSVLAEDGHEILFCDKDVLNKALSLDTSWRHIV